MAESQPIWGIDVGKCALKAVQLRLAADKSIELVETEYIEHAKIISQQDADKDNIWSAALEKFLSRHDISKDKVAVSVPGQLTLSRFSKLPPVEKKKIPDIVRYEADQQIPFDIDEVVWDYQVFETEDSPEVEVGIFAIKRELIRDHLLHFEAAGIEPMLVQSVPLAVYNALAYDGSLGDGTTILIDIGTENTDLLVATEDNLWARTIPVGGNNFTEALVKAFKLSFGKAETLKRTAASSKYARQVFQAMRPVFSDLVQELQRSIGFYTATHRDAELGKVIGLGSAFKLPGLVKYLHQNLQLNVEYLKGFNKIALPDKGSSSQQPANFPVAYGLALQGLQQAPVTSSLLPPEVAQQIIWRQKRPFFAAAAACVLLAAGVIWFRQMSDAGTLADNAGNPPRSMSLEQGIRTIENPPQAPPREFGATVHLAAQTLKREHSKLAGQGDDEMKKIEQIQRQLEHRAVWLRIVDAIHKAIPQPSTALRNIDSAEEYVSIIESGGANLRRGNREEIFIERLDARFEPNLDEVELVDEWTRRIKDPIEAKGRGVRKGFIIALKCRTPNEDAGAFVNRVVQGEFFERLREFGRRSGQGFYINRVALTDIGNAEDASGQGGRGRDRGRGRGRGGRGGREKRDSTVKKPDPLTGEDMSDDFEFVVTLDVVLDDLPEKDETES